MPARCAPPGGGDERVAHPREARGVERRAARRRRRRSGTADGATGVQPPASIAVRPPTHGAARRRLAARVRELQRHRHRRRDAARTGERVGRARARSRRRRAPGSVGVIRPSGATAVASMTNIAAPDCSNWPQWTRCQSAARPSTAEYWHIGETTMRLASARPRSAKGSNRATECAPRGGGRWQRGSRAPAATRARGGRAAVPTRDAVPAGGQRTTMSKRTVFAPGADVSNGRRYSSLDRLRPRRDAAEVERGFERGAGGRHAGARRDVRQRHGDRDLAGQRFQVPAQTGARRLVSR